MQIRELKFGETEYEGFTDRALAVMKSAGQKAKHHQHEHIGTEHILWGFVKEWNGIGVIALNKLGIKPDAILSKLEELIWGARQPSDAGEKKLTPRALKILELAKNWAKQLHHNYIGTEHLLLGMLTEAGSAAHAILTSLFAGQGYLTLSMVKIEIEKALAPVDETIIASLCGPTHTVVENPPLDISQVKKAFALNLERMKGDNVNQLRMLLREFVVVPPDQEIISLVFYTKK